MQVNEIYIQYNIPSNLQKHMLRVAALSQIIAENWINGKLDKISIVSACLFHDMANIIKFNFDKPLLFEEEKHRINYWKKIQRGVLQTYGTNIHKATLKICKEIGLSERVQMLINKLKWSNSLSIIKNQDFESAICIYCDMRIGPFGILSLQERLTNLQKRNTMFDFDFISSSAASLEKFIQRNISVSTDLITDNQLSKRFNGLMKVSI